MWIVQISDLHNSANKTSEKINKIICEMSTCINNYVPESEKLIFVICGDVLNKGDKSGFNHTLDFFKELLKKISIKDIEFIICPGNHDIVDNSGIKSFIEFDKFIFELTKDTKIQFKDKSSNLKTINNIDFIIINSSYHLNKNYGNIDLLKLNDILKQSKNEKKIIIVHHHLIPTEKEQNSAIVNAYEFLKLLEKNNVLAILHGHQHMKMEMVVGIGLSKIVGVGSLLAQLPGNYNNQFNLININNDNIETIIELKYTMEELGENGTLGKFKP